MAKSHRTYTVEEFAGYKSSFNCLADADVVGDQQADRVQLEGHEQWHELVWPRLDGEMGERTKWTRARTEPEPERVAE